MSVNEIDKAAFLKGAVPTEGNYEAKHGAHYYAFSPSKTDYLEAFANIVLPPPPVGNKLNFKNIPDTGTQTNYTRNGYISLGIMGSSGDGIDLGLRKDKDFNWHPCRYDVKMKTDGFPERSFKAYSEYEAPENATNALIVAKPVSTTAVHLYVQFLDSSGKNVGRAFDQDIEVASGNLTMSGGKIQCKFYRFASLVQEEGAPDNKMDSTFMINAKFTNLGLYNRNTGKYDAWGINTSLIEQAWRVSPERATVSYTNNSDSFRIDHWYQE